MGGEGSGRKPDPIKRLIGFNQPSSTDLSPSLYLPNYSGVKSAALKTSTTSYVPYTGATANVDLGLYTLTAKDLIAMQNGSKLYLGSSAIGGDIYFGGTAFNRISYGSNEFGFATSQPLGFVFHDADVTIDENLSAAEITGETLTISSGAVLFAGTGGTYPTSSEKTKFMWIPASGAIRAGYASSTQWDQANIGLRSVAFGDSCIASSGASTAFGRLCTASGLYSIAGGYSNDATAYGAVALGDDNTASGTDAVALGKNCTASGAQSVAIGFGVKAYSGASVALGTSIISDGAYSVGIGLDGTPRTISTANVMSIMGGNVGIGTLAPTQLLEVNGMVSGASVFAGNGFTGSGAYTNFQISGGVIIAAS